MLINFKCEKCNLEKPKILDKSPTKDDKYYCNTCNSILIRVYAGMSTNTVENVDNGFSFKQIDYDAQRAELYRAAGDEIIKRIKGDK